MQTPNPNDAPAPPEYIVLLPDPSAVKTLGENPAGAVQPEVHAALERLNAASGAAEPALVQEICHETIKQFAPQVSAETAATGPAGFYDLYFAVRRLPPSADKSRILCAMTVALAVVIKATARKETESTHLSAVEFGLLRQAFATVVESLQELANKTSTPPAP